MELFAETGGCIYDLTDICTELSWMDILNDGAGYFDFSYKTDSKIGLIERGVPVRLTDNNQKTGIFCGIVLMHLPIRRG